MSDDDNESKRYRHNDFVLLLLSIAGFCTQFDMDKAGEMEFVYSGTPLNGHPSTADTHVITDNSESPDCPSVHFNT